jgi:LysM repeat protein
MLIVLFVWNRVQESSTPTPIPAATLLAEEGANQPTAPPASPTPPEPIQYVVQDGDTLGAIAQAFDVSVEDLMLANGLVDPNLLSVGQTLVIPVNPPLAPPTDAAPETPPELSPTSIPTLTPSGPSQVEIGQVLGAGDLETEVVVVRNLGGAVDLEGWTLSDAEGNTFTFPTITLFADVQMRVHSLPGLSTPSDLYWGRESPAWNTGELVTLYDRTGNVIDTYIVP